MTQLPDQAKKALAWSGAALVLIAASFSAGRFSAPLKIETRDVEKVLWKERVVEKVVEKVVTVEARAKLETRTIYVDRVVTKEGEVRERIVERLVTAEEAKKLTTDDTSKDLAKTNEGERLHEVVKTVTLQPAWRVGLLVGASLRDPFVPIAGPLVLGAQVEHRLVGGVSAGLWLNTVGAVGVVVSLEF